MGRAPCCGDHEGLKKGPWTAEEDQKLIHYAQSHGLGNWRSLPKLAGLSRCGKSCRLRWANYLRPDIKRGTFSMQEDLTIIRLHAVVGNKWSAIASHLPGRTDNEIKNHWNTKLKKRLLLLGIDPVTHMSLPRTDIQSSFMASSSTAIAARLNNALAESQLGQLVRDSVNISQHVSAGSAQYSWQLSQILKLLGPFSSISTDALKWLHVSQNQFNEGFLSGQKDNSTEYNVFSQESSQFSDLEQKSEGKNLPITTDDRNEHWIASSLIKDQPSTFNTEITEWNSMPILMPSINPDKNDQLFYYSDQKSSSTTFTNSFGGGSEILENTIHYHQDDPFGSEIRTSDTVSPPTDRQEDESNYWVDLLNSIEGSNPDTDYMNLVPLSSP